MIERCDTAAVLGGGVMGSGIAAHLAGAGIRVYLLDIVPPNLTDSERTQVAARNRFAQSGLDKVLKSKPAAFFDQDAAKMIIPGNLDDDLDKIALCDLVIEAVVERMDVKKALFAKIAPQLRKDAMLASNTSGLSIAHMTESLPKALQEHFLVMHFFNPVRYMRLLELVPGPHTSPAIMKRAAALGEALGKGIVYGKDTPNFVANRIGVHGLMRMMKAMQACELTVEEVDKVAGRPMGRPASAAFRTADIVGLDTFMHVAQNCYDLLPNDEERSVFTPPDFMKKLVESGRLGQKSGAGFYKKVGNDILVLDLQTLDYRPQKKVRFEALAATKGVEDVGERLKTLVNFDDPAGRFAWASVAPSLAYSARRIGEIADDVINIDCGMRWGFNWDLGPFEAWDAIGVAPAAERMAKDGIAVPPIVEKMLKTGRTSFYAGQPSQRTYFDFTRQAPAPMPTHAQHIQLPALRDNKKRIVQSNMGASLVDLGDGCLCLEVNTKMNTVDNDVIAMMGTAVQVAEKDFEALVVGNDGEHFGAGANLMLIYMAAQQQAWDQVQNVVSSFQQAVQGLRYAKVPVVAAPFNYTFGGAAEIAMGADACEAYAETYMGLVEVGVGLVPAGGGCLRMVERWCANTQGVEGVDLLPFIGQASMNIATAKVGTSAEEAKRLRYLLPTDGISLNRERLLHHAKQRALGMARAGYVPPRPRVLKAAGWDAARTIGMRVWSMKESAFASDHDALIANKVAQIVCGGKVAAGTELTEQHFLELEREAFLSLCGEEKTQARMQSILMNNKPLRN